jgi:hypothetical protein
MDISQDETAFIVDQLNLDRDKNMYTHIAYRKIDKMYNTMSSLKQYMVKSGA